MKAKRTSDQPQALPRWHGAVAWINDWGRQPRWRDALALLKDFGFGGVCIAEDFRRRLTEGQLRTYRETADELGLFRVHHTVADRDGWALRPYSGELGVYYDGAEMIDRDPSKPPEGQPHATSERMIFMSQWVELLHRWSRVPLRLSSAGDYGGELGFGRLVCTADGMLDFGRGVAGTTLQDGVDACIGRMPAIRARGQFPVIGWVGLPSGEPLGVDEWPWVFAQARRHEGAVHAMGNRAFYESVPAPERAACRELEKLRMAGAMR